MCTPQRVRDAGPPVQRATVSRYTTAAQSSSPQSGVPGVRRPRPPWRNRTTTAAPSLAPRWRTGAGAAR